MTTMTLHEALYALRSNRFDLNGIADDIADAIDAHLAKGAQVPDAIAGPGVVMSRQDAYDASYAEGWNACRQVMLSQRGEVGNG